MYQSPNTDNAASSEEVSQLRREMASMAAALRTASEAQANSTPNATGEKPLGARGTVAANNRRVLSKRFSVAVGPGAEEAEDFQEKWVALLKSHLAFDFIKDDLGRLIVHCINEKQRDLTAADHTIVDVLLHAANIFGKGANVYALPAHCPRAATHTLSSLISISCCTAKPTNATINDLSDEDSSDEDEAETEDEAAAEPMDRASAKKAAKEAAEKRRERERAKLAAAVDQTWAAMDQDEQTAYRDAILNRDTLTEKQVAITSHTSPLLTAASLALIALSFCVPAAAHDADEGTFELPLPHAEAQAARGRARPRAVHWRR